MIPYASHTYSMELLVGLAVKVCVVTYHSAKPMQSRIQMNHTSSSLHNFPDPTVWVDYYRQIKNNK